MKRFGFAQSLLALVAIGGIASGCGGVRGSHSVSPATFFMPGLMHHEPAQPAPVAAPSSIESSPRLSGPADRALPS